jgi:uncharacterized membrane protein
MRLTSGDLEPSELSRSLRRTDDREMAYRRGIVVVSLLGIVSMGVVSLFQTGAVKHLPDPPVRKPRFNSEKVNSSDEAYSYGMPDAPLTVVMQAVNLAIASAGPAGRTRKRPWLALLATATAGVQAAMAAKYLFYQMPKIDRAWCPYCVFDALTHFATFALTLPETLKAYRLAEDVDNPAAFIAGIKPRPAPRSTKGAKPLLPK